MLASRSLLLLLALLPGGALATASFPNVVRAEAGMPRCVPECTLCHATTAGGTGTVTKPFGQALYARGVRQGNLSLLRQGLTQLRDEAVDSDGDGTPDMTELAQLRSPNTAGNPDGGPADPLEVTNPACLPPPAGPDAGTPTDGGDGGPPPPEEEELPAVTYGCSTGAGGLAVTGVLLATLAAAVRRRRR